MAAEPLATTSIGTAAPATEKDLITAESPSAADTVRWEFRLTADRRRILVPVDRIVNLELE